MESFIVGKKPLTVRRTGFIEQPLKLEAKRVQDPNRGQKWSSTGQPTNQNPHYNIFSLAAAPTSCDQRLSLNVARIITGNSKPLDHHPPRSLPLSAAIAWYYL
ncbi:hypothetical protein QC763_0065270 [Podospora pseudopauciseta]|uniref:Uncharacterized protein n=1 Tax=Podospora pseudopauciseta TaxID=2093780 RepID=A0ABR0HCW3_9PEZI|nr:hypothetical protein QC763_0065270 [Podospora pseudopauciseta]